MNDYLESALDHHTCNSARIARAITSIGGIFAASGTTSRILLRGGSDSKSKSYAFAHFASTIAVVLFVVQCFALWAAAAEARARRYSLEKRFLAEWAMVWTLLLSVATSVAFVACGVVSLVLSQK